MFKRFLKAIKKFWIPYEGNKHRPLALRSKSLRSYAYFLISIKILVTLLLCSFYPSPAFLALKIQDKIIDLINQTRQERSFNILKVNNDLTLAAQAKAQDMIDKDYFAHTSPDGRRSWEWVNRDKYYYLAFGENLAMDFTSAETAQAALMDSPAHAKNILNPKYEDIGIGVAAGEINDRETIVLVQFFGRAKAVAAINGLTTENQVKAGEKVEERKNLTTQEFKNQKTGEPININVQESKNVTIEAAKIAIAPPAPKEMTGSKITPQSILGEAMPEEKIYLDRNLTDTSPLIVRVEETNQAKNFLNRIILYTDWLLWGFLIFLTASLLLNIVVHIKIQNPALIGQSLFVILIIVSLLLFKVHFIEEMVGRVISII